MDESRLTFFHGRIRIHIIAAEDLPDTDTAFFNIDGKDVTDPYVTGDFGYARLFKTRYIANDLNPQFDEIFNVYVCHHASSLAIRVKDKEHVGASFLGSTLIRGEDLINGDPIEGWFDLMNSGENVGRINLSVQFFPKEEEDKALANSYFPMRENGRFILYQDADTPQLPQVSF